MGFRVTKPAAALWKLSHYFTRSNTPLAWVQSNGCVRVFARWHLTRTRKYHCRLVRSMLFARRHRTPKCRSSFSRSGIYTFKTKNTLTTVYMSKFTSKTILKFQNTMCGVAIISSIILLRKVFWLSAQSFQPIILVRAFFSRLRRAFNHSSLIILVKKVFRLRLANQSF